MSGLGWGSGAWGSAAWGSFGADELSLATAIAVNENAIRLIFTRPVYFSAILDTHDASHPEFHTISVVPGSMGLDGTFARAVNVVQVLAPTIPGLVQNQVLDVILDRPMTPYSAQYKVDVSPNLVTSDLATVITTTTATLFGVFKEIVPPSLESPVPRRDIANPQTLATQANGSFPTLGSYVSDGGGDYAFDEGKASFKKRLFRRCMTKKGGFVHLPNYGLGLPSYGKRLALATVRAQIAADAEAQIAREPEVAKIVASSTFDARGLFKLILHVRLRAGIAARYEVPFQT